MYCRKCGKEVVGEVEFCEDCAPKAEPTETKICEYCGKETSKAERFCQHCHGFFKDSTAPQKKWQPSNNTTASVQNVSTKTCRACGRSIPKTDFYCSKCGKMADTLPTEPVNAGSFWLGALLVWLLSFIGLIIARVIDQPETWRGAKFWFKFQIIVTIVLVVIYFVFMWDLINQGVYY